MDGKNGNNVVWALKTFRWLCETEKLIQSKKRTSLKVHLKNCGFTEEEKKEAMALWKRK